MRIVYFWVLFKLTDLCTTYLCLTKYTKTMDAEGNPFMKMILDYGSWGGAALFLLTVSLILYALEVRYGKNRYMRLILWFGVSLNILISIWNASIYILI